MLLELNVIEGAYLQDLLAQPEALRRSLEGFEATGELKRFAQALDSYERIVLTGMGSSLFALYPLHLTLADRGYPSLLIEASELIHYLPGVLTAQTLVIAVSQSGQSAEVLRLLQLVQGRAPLIAITNTAASPLANQADAAILLQAGPESSVSCKTYVASLLALEWLAAVLTGKDLAQTKAVLKLAAPAAQSYLSNWKSHVVELGPVVAGIDQIFVAGRGPSVATAQTGGLILKESTRCSAEGMSCAAFRHGPFEMLTAKVLVLILAGDSQSEAMNRRLAADVQQAGGRAVVIDDRSPAKVFRIPSAPQPILPVLEILPVQMVSLALAARSGREAGVFQLATKVTTVE